MFYIDDVGKKQDKEIHDQILDNPEAERDGQLISRNIALAIPGIKPSDLDRMYRASRRNRFV